jgi:cytochrome c553
MLALAGAGQAMAESLGDPEKGKEIYMNGKGDVAACMTCHGEDGLGDDNMGTPRLAGQGYGFVVKQLKDFAEDKRQDLTMFIMNFNAKGLEEQDWKDVAAYVSTLDKGIGGSNLKEIVDNGLAPIGVRYLGKSIVQYGAPARGIPACHSCHGYNARGAFPVYPRLAGQRYIYLVNQLQRWRDGSRTNDPMNQMQVVAQKLTDDDIHNVATFLTNAPLTTMGNSRVPADH